ncbi:C-5 sterol desaturase [Zancudomyces culisetae]|uniref:C-5 sterol desaturase n=1 Tax=Zancudomyces culisetae TaxID=1213189 RepID=A0A1R1PWN7_ZANCU|nr:C-5 sterol desaturase [Zancudomyces culisetae]|eukprot:OMH85354.1 C-5 sterol desaturase [Zancudomyces culisetae]
MIHDGNYISDNPVINGAAHHTIHHLYFNYNYGQFTTLFDRMFNSHRRPTQEIYNATIRKSKTEILKQVKDIDAIESVIDAKKSQ